MLIKKNEGGKPLSVAAMKKITGGRVYCTPLTSAGCSGGGDNACWISEGRCCCAET